MSNIQKKTKVIIAICSLVLVASVVLGIAFFMKKPHANSPSSGNNTSQVSYDFSSIKRDTSISVENGTLKVNRTQKEETPMGADSTWTILMYFCGTNLEEQYSAASKDFKEMINSNLDKASLDKLNIIIQTVGCKKWQSNNIPNNKIGRYRVTDSNQLELIETIDDASSGDPNTLYSFLDWGVTNYPAKNMGVILWDHGSGPIYGVCRDEKFDSDGLTLQEMEYSFAKVSKNMSSKFEFIGFDTCLSGCIEYANAFAPYANYMIASAQTEPGDGWYYTPVLKYLKDNLDCNGLDLGKVICDSYTDYYSNDIAKDDITLATFDLNKVDNAMIELNYLTKYLSDAISSKPECANILLEMLSDRVKFGTFNEIVDIGSLISYFDETKDFNYDTTYFKSAFNELMCYKKICEPFASKGAIGITMYLPKDVISYNLLLQYRNACFSPYHMSLIEKLFYAKQNYDWKDYIDFDWTKSSCFYEDSFEFLENVIDNIYYEPNLHKAMMAVPKYANDGFLEAWYNNFSLYSPIHKKTYTRNAYNVKFDEKLDNNNTKYTAKIEKDSLKYVETVYSTVFAKDGDNLLCLGENVNVNYNDDNGKVSSTFNKEWFMLPDGQFLTTYVISHDSKTKTTVYSIPVVINEIESSIRIKEEKVNDEYKYTCLGVWDSISNSNYAGRGYLPLNSGTVITPIYDVYKGDTDNYESEYGEEYTISSDFDFLFGKLPKGEYSYAYSLQCINGNNVYSSLKSFTN